MNFQTPSNVTTTTKDATSFLPRMDPLFRERVDPLGETEVQLGQSAFTVRGKNQAHFIVTDIDVGMMFLILGHFGHPIHEID
jgi:hypothetical protein